MYLADILVHNEYFMVL